VYEMDQIQNYMRSFLNLLANSSSSVNEEEHAAKHKIVLFGFSLDQIIHHGNFYLLEFLKPESVFSLILVNKSMASLLTDDVIEKYGSKIKPSAQVLLNGCNLSYRKYFLQELRRSSFADYKLGGKMIFCKNGEEVIQPFYSNLLLKKDDWLNQSVTLKELFVTFTPQYYPRWLRNEGMAEVFSIDILNPRSWLHHGSFEPFNVDWEISFGFKGKTNHEATLAVMPELHWYDDAMRLELLFDGINIGDMEEELIGDNGKKGSQKIAKMFDLKYQSEMEKSLSAMW